MLPGYMKVYRVQNYMGEGPYTSLLQQEKWQDEPHGWRLKRCSAPGDDLKLKAYLDEVEELGSKSFRFGFSSMAQFESWFTVSERTKLKSLGFSLVEYEIHEIHVFQGDTQLMFKWMHAVCVNQTPLIDVPVESYVNQNLPAIRYVRVGESLTVEGEFEQLPSKTG